MALIRETDYGTPKRISGTLVEIEVDGKAVSAPACTSVMRDAAEAGIQIPKLCASDTLEPFGSCRLCLVEVEGRRGFPASCTTPCENGMKIRTQSPKLEKLRKGVMELYASDYPREMFEGAASGDTEFQQMLTAVGLKEVRYGYKSKNHQDGLKDDSNPYFEFDQSKCIVCSRCVRACEEVQGTFALTIDGRGFASFVSAGDKPFMESECVSCGACVLACPTDALLEKSVIQGGRPDHSVTTTCAYCGVGCSFNAEMKGSEVVRMTPDKDGKANHHTASEFKRIQAKYGRDSIGGITSSRCTNEETYLVQKMIRAAFGNN